MEVTALLDELVDVVTVGSVLELLDVDLDDIADIFCAVKDSDRQWIRSDSFKKVLVLLVDVVDIRDFDIFRDVKGHIDHL